MFRFLFTLFAIVFIAIPGEARSGEVVNAGVGGNRSGHLLARLERDVLAQRPTVVIIMVGTNDRLNSAGFTKPYKYRKNVEMLVDSIQSTGANAFLITPPPCIEELLYTRHDPRKFAGQSPVERMEEVREILIRIAKEKKVGLLDFHRYLVENKLADDRESSLIRNPRNSGAKDGVHLTDAGYRRLADLVADQLRALKLDTSKVVCFGDSITRGSASANYPGNLKTLLDLDPSPDAD